MIPDDRTKIGTQDRYRIGAEKELKESDVPQKPDASEDDQRKRSRFREALSSGVEERSKPKATTQKTEHRKDSLFSMAAEEFEKSKKPTDTTEAVDHDLLLAVGDEPKKSSTEQDDTLTEGKPVAPIPLFAIDQSKNITPDSTVKTKVIAITEENAQDATKKGKDSPDSTVKPFLPNMEQTVPIAPAAAATPKEQSTATTREALLQIVQQVADAMKQITLPDRTNTEITLNRPPIFEGVTIVLTEFSSAKDQFNLTFHNLTNPVARQMIELADNQTILREQLLAKGYTLQTVTIEPKLDVTVQVEHTELRDQNRDFEEHRDDQDKHQEEQ